MTRFRWLWTLQLLSSRAEQLRPTYWGRILKMFLRLLIVGMVSDEVYLMCRGSWWGCWWLLSCQDEISRSQILDWTQDDFLHCVLSGVFLNSDNLIRAICIWITCSSAPILTLKKLYLERLKIAKLENIHIYKPRRRTSTLGATLININPRIIKAESSNIDFFLPR